jgi:hypothetical protein
VVVKNKSADVGGDATAEHYGQVRLRGRVGAAAKEVGRFCEEGGAAISAGSRERPAVRERSMKSAKEGGATAKRSDGFLCGIRRNDSRRLTRAGGPPYANS